MSTKKNVGARLGINSLTWLFMFDETMDTVIKTVKPSPIARTISGVELPGRNRLVIASRAIDDLRFRKRRADTITSRPIALNTIHAITALTTNQTANLVSNAVVIAIVAKTAASAAETIT